MPEQLLTLNAAQRQGLINVARARYQAALLERNLPIADRIRNVIISLEQVNGTLV